MISRADAVPVCEAYRNDILSYLDADVDTL
jgi:hypothetical protein